MLYINGNTGEREEITGHQMNPEVGTVVCEFTIGGETPADIVVYEGNLKEEIMPKYRFEVQNRAGKVVFVKTNLTYKEVVGWRGTVNKVRKDVDIFFDRCCPKCGFWMFNFRDIDLCMNDPECTYSKTTPKEEDYTTAL